MFKPVWPVLFDKIAHLCWEYEHMQVVHQHNGIYHVDQELRNETDKGKKEDNNQTYKFQVSDYFHITSEAVNEFLISATIVKNYSTYFSYSPKALRDTDYPPPKA